MLQDPAIVQMQVKLCIRRIGYSNPSDGKQPGFPIRKREALGIEQRFVSSIGGHRPLQRFVTLQPLVVHPNKQRRQRRYLIHHFRRVLIVPPCSQGTGDVLNDLPIRPATLEWIENLVEPLDAPLRAGESPFLFEAGRSGQTTIGVSPFVAEENALYNEKTKFLKCSAKLVRVRIDDANL